MTTNSDPSDTTSIDEMIAYIESPEYIRMTAKAQHDDPSSLLGEELHTPDPGVLTAYHTYHGSRVVDARAATAQPPFWSAHYSDYYALSNENVESVQARRDRERQDRQDSGLLTTRDNPSVFRGFLETFRPFRTHGALKGIDAPDGTGRLSEDYTRLFERTQAHIDYVVYSYDTPIAWHVWSTSSHSAHWVFPETQYSVTTSRHQSQINLALAMMDVEVDG
jgi:hypothetical protein